MAKRKSLEQRLYEAFHNNRGMRLSAEDVDSIVLDDAMATRITNMACLEAGSVEFGVDDFTRRIRNLPTWEHFVEIQGSE